MASDEFECPVPSAMDDYDRLRRNRGEGMNTPLSVMIRCRDPAEAAERIREGHAAAGIPQEIAEAMIEGTLDP